LVEDAVSLEELEAAFEAGTWEALVHSPDLILESWHAALLHEEHARDTRSGQLLVLEPVRPEFKDLALETPCRAYSEEGEFLAILKYRGAGRWHPEKVFSAL
jgi:hypothetical protein